MSSYAKPHTLHRAALLVLCPALNQDFMSIIIVGRHNETDPPGGTNRAIVPVIEQAIEPQSAASQMSSQ